jgi:hypothetical protein
LADAEDGWRELFNKCEMRTHTVLNHTKYAQLKLRQFCFYATRQLYNRRGDRRKYSKKMAKIPLFDHRGNTMDKKRQNIAAMNRLVELHVMNEIGDALLNCSLR